MKKIKLLISFFLICSFRVFCQTQPIPSIGCPILIGPYGSQMVISFESAKKICKNRVKFINIGQKSRTPITGEGSQGVYERIKNDSMVMVAITKYEIGLDGLTFKMYKGIGKNSYWLGSPISDKIYTIGQDSTIHIIGYKSKNYIMPSGFSARMTKGTGKNDYYAGCDDGKIYKVKGENGFEQIGIAAYFWIPIENNPQLQRTILMTKGMKPNDRWCGEMDGIIYIFK